AKPSWHCRSCRNGSLAPKPSLTSWKNSTSSSEQALGSESGARMPVDLVLRQARRAKAKEALVDIGIADGRIVKIAEHIVADAPAEELDGRLVVESHIHAHPRPLRR